MITIQIHYLGTGLRVIELKTNGVPGMWWKLGFAVDQGIKQQAGLELVCKFRIGKTVDETLDSYFFRRKPNYRHDGPPSRQDGLESLAVLSADSSASQYRISDRYHGHGYEGTARSTV